MPAKLFRGGGNSLMATEAVPPFTQNVRNNPDFGAPSESLYGGHQFICEGMSREAQRAFAKLLGLEYEEREAADAKA